MTILIANDVWSGPKLLFGMLNGKKIAYSSETMFYVQIGKRAKGAYKNEYVIKGNLYRAANYYNSINIGLGFKKRLVMAGKVLAKQCSS